MTFDELYVDFYEKNIVNKMVLGLSKDELRLVFSKVNSDDYKKVLNNLVCVAEMFAKRLKVGEDYYDFIKEFIFRHCNEITKISSNVQVLGYMSTVRNVFYFLCAYESVKGIANYINSKPLSFFFPKEFMKNRDIVVNEFPQMHRFFNAFKTENKIVTDKEDFALDITDNTVIKLARTIRNDAFDSLRNNYEEYWVRQCEDIELVITPPVFNAFLYQNDCEGCLYASFGNGHYNIRECIAHNDEDKHALIDRVLKMYPFDEFVYCDDDSNTIALLGEHGFIKDKFGTLKRQVLKSIDYLDWYYPRCNFEYKEINLKENIRDDKFTYKGETYAIRLDLFYTAFLKNILRIQKGDSFVGIVGVNVKKYFITNNCRYIVYQNYCCKKGQYECFDVETGKISSYHMNNDNNENTQNAYRDIQDIAFAKSYSVQTGYLVKKANKVKYVSTFSVRKNCMYLPYNVPDNAIAHIGFDIISHTVVVYNCSELFDEQCLMALDLESFGERIKFFKTENELFCESYSDEEFSKAQDFLFEKLKELSAAYKILFNRPFQLNDELPQIGGMGLMVSGNSLKYNAFKDYFRKHRKEFNLSYVLDFEEIDSLFGVGYRSDEKMLENTHIVFKALFDYGYSCKKIRQFYRDNSLFFNQIFELTIEEQTVNDILKFIKSMMYLDKNHAVQMLLPSVLLCKSGRRHDFSGDDDLLEAYETLTNQN